MDAETGGLNGGSGAHARPAIDLAHEADFQVGSLHVRPSLRSLDGPEGTERIEPKMMQMMVAFAREPGVLLSKDDLIDLVWDGRIVGDNSINRILSLLRSALRETAGDAVSIETVPKVGYRLLFEGVVARDPDAATAPSAETAPQRKRPIALLVALAVLVAAIIGFSQWQGRDQALPQISIVMLPATNGEGVDPFFAGGLAGAIHDEVGRQAGVEITNVTSAGQMAAGGRSVQEIGASLGADYLLSIDVGSGNDVVLVSLDLVDADDGRSIWSETMRSGRNQSRELPHRVRRAMMEALNRPLTDRLVDTNVTAADYSIYLVAMGKLATRDRGDRGVAIPMLEQVVERNPRFAAGLGGLAKAYYLGRGPSAEARVAGRQEARDLAFRALAIDPDDQEALKVAGKLATDREEMLSYLNRAVEADPSDSEAWYWLTIVLRQTTAPHAERRRALQQLVAVDPLWAPNGNSADGALMMGDRDLAIALENAIIAASVNPALADLARARLARLDGDLSGFLKQAEAARPRLEQTYYQYGAHLQTDFVRFMLGLEPQHLLQREYPLLLDQVERGRPARADQIPSADGFYDAVLASEQFRALTNSGQQARMVAGYDARFDSIESLESWARDNGIAHSFLPAIAADLAPALNRAGRSAEARSLVRAAERELSAWSLDRGTTMRRLALEARLAASLEQGDRALARLRDLIARGWPYTISHTPKADLAPLVPDRHFEALENRDEIEELLAPIRARLAQERVKYLGSAQ